MQSLELTVPPVALMLLAGGFMWIITWATPALEFTFPAGLICAAGAVLIGITMAGMGVFSFSRAKTTVNPMKPDSSSALVVSGVYRLTRNPMYLGILLLLIGWGIFLSNALAFPARTIHEYLLRRPILSPGEAVLVQPSRRTASTPASASRASSLGGLPSRTPRDGSHE